MPKVNLQTIQLVNRFQELRTEIVKSVALGKYKNYKTAMKEYSSLGVKNFDVVKSLTSAPQVTVPLLSKAGWNMFKVWFLNKFRIKSPDEKLFNKMVKEEKLLQKYFKQ